MEFSSDKITINTLVTYIVPGFVTILFSLWVGYCYYPQEIESLLKNQWIFLFVTILIAYILGIFIDKLGQKLEDKTSSVWTMRTQTLNRFSASLYEMDDFFFEKLKLHLFETDKQGNFKQGDFLDIKMDKHNIGTFEKFMLFVLTENDKIIENLDFKKNQYLLFRNLIIAFIIGIIGMFFLIYISFKKPNGCILLLQLVFISIVAIIVLVFTILFFFEYRTKRKDYLFTLYQSFRFYIAMYS